MRHYIAVAFLALMLAVALSLSVKSAHQESIESTLSVLPTSSISLVPTASLEARRLILNAPVTIDAGDAWSMNIRVNGGQVGEKIQATLFNGLYREATELVLGTGGVAEWQIPVGIITQAGQSLVVLHYQDIEARQNLRVLPKNPQSIDLVTTANNLTAYGDGRAMLVALPRDEWGNQPGESTDVTASVQFPESNPQTIKFQYRDGLAWTELQSQGAPGRVRIRMQVATAEAYLELMQVAGSPENITISLMPACVLADGRDLVSLTAAINDAHGHPVTNGTVVKFMLENGSGDSQTIDGRASLRLPAPTETGIYYFEAVSAAAHSSQVALRVEAESCE